MEGKETILRYKLKNVKFAERNHNNILADGKLDSNASSQISSIGSCLRLRLWFLLVDSVPLTNSILIFASINYSLGASCIKFGGFKHCKK